jgi:hypothetical protein
MPAVVETYILYILPLVAEKKQSNTTSVHGFEDEVVGSERLFFWKLYSRAHTLASLLSHYTRKRLIATST